MLYACFSRTLYCAYSVLVSVRVPVIMQVFLFKLQCRLFCKCVLVSVKDTTMQMVCVSVEETLQYVCGVLFQSERLYYVSGGHTGVLVSVVSGVLVSVGETLYYASGVRGDPVVILPSPSGSTAVSCEDHVTLLPVHGTLHGPCPLCCTYTIVYY